MLLAAAVDRTISIEKRVLLQKLKKKTRELSLRKLEYFAHLLFGNVTHTIIRKEIVCEERKSGSSFFSSLSGSVLFVVHLFYHFNARSNPESL